ncbi:MAG TPA: glutamate racemase [Roseiflexaceae bacterium]|nr:glutamate racemase [Roseiflexaceae bacterium]
MDRRTTGPIGLFDSGVGGGTVLAELRRRQPAEDLLFLADQAHCPYGPRAPDELRALALANTRWLLARGAKLVVVACNTASAAALHWLRRTFPTTPFVGMVPAVKPAVRQTRSGVVGVLATPAIVAGGLLREVVEQWAGGARVIAQACPGLAERVEAGALEDPATDALLESYLAPLTAAGADTIVLGCTHYPFLLPAIRRIAGPQVAVIDAAPAVAAQASRVLADHGLLHPDPQRAGRTCYATTGDPAHLAALIARLGLPPGEVVGAEVG